MLVEEAHRLRWGVAQLKPIGTCSNIPEANMYAESNKNMSFPYTNHTVVTSANSDNSTGSTSRSSSQSTNSAVDGRIPVSWIVTGLIGGGWAMALSVAY